MLHTFIKNVLNFLTNSQKEFRKEHKQENSIKMNKPNNLSIGRE